MLPDNLRDFLTGNLWAEIDQDDDQGNMRKMVEAGKAGRCMACGASLGPTTLVLMSSQGIGAVYCGGVCITDLQVLGYLQEAHEEIIHRIGFRGQSEERAEPEE